MNSKNSRIAWPRAASQAPAIAPAVCKAPAMQAPAHAMQAPAHAMPTNRWRVPWRVLHGTCHSAWHGAQHLPSKSTRQPVSVCPSVCPSVRGSVGPAVCHASKFHALRQASRSWAVPKHSRYADTRGRKVWCYITSWGALWKSKFGCMWWRHGTVVVTSRRRSSGLHCNT